MQFIKVTAVGGIIFLVPVTVLIIIFGKIASFLSKLAAPLAAWVLCRHFRYFPCALLTATVFICNATLAQELAPRAYWPTPNGTNVFVLAYQHSTGDIVTDASLPVTGVDSSIDYLQLSYQKTFNLSGRTATLQLSVPFSDGTTKGFVDGGPRRRDTSGMADTRIRIAINLKGAPSMDGAGFKALRDSPKTIIGASFLVQAPTGEYEADKVINLGTNRWSVKPAIGVSDSPKLVAGIRSRRLVFWRQR